MGRPRIGDSVRRDKVFRFRVTEEEREVIERASKPYEASSWARSVLLAIANLPEVEALLYREMDRLDTKRAIEVGRSTRDPDEAD